MLARTLDVVWVSAAVGANADFQPVCFSVEDRTEINIGAEEAFVYGDRFARVSGHRGAGAGHIEDLEPQIVLASDGIVVFVGEIALVIECCAHWRGAEPGCQGWQHKTDQDEVLKLSHKVNWIYFHGDIKG